MKKLITFITASLLVMTITNINAQTFESRVIENDVGYLVYQMRETSGTGTPTTSTIINDITFVVRYPSGAVDIDLICTSNDYNIIDGLAGEQTSIDGYDYHYWNGNALPINSPTDWTVNVWENIVMFKAFGATGSSLFEVAPDGWDGRSHNWNQGDPPVDYTPTPNGDVTYSYPTVIYDLVWTGADATYPTFWDIAANWETECGGTGSIPNTGNNCFIPVVASGNYPTDIGDVAGFGKHQPICDYLKIAAGATLSIDDKDFGGTQALYTVNNDFQVYGTATIVPNGQLTVSGDTYLDADQSLVIEASEVSGVTSVGSFIDDGSQTTISYGTNGSANVQIHLYYGTPHGTQTFYFHQVGPTVDNAASFSGQYLEDFNLNPYDDYAYQYDESVAPGGQPWVNIWEYTEEIYTTSGMMISTDIPEQHTLDMVGELLTGSVTSDPLGHTPGGTYLEMISNPYPSAIDFDAFRGNNTTIIKDKNWVWDASAYNYFARVDGAGGVQNIQVGQAFFVETYGTGTVSFANSDRVHSTDPFRNVMTNILTLDMKSAESSNADQLVIRFKEGATTGYDDAIEAIKWNSMNESVAMIRSIAEDGTELSVNVMPELDLQGEMVSVPVQFQTGVAGEYSLTASDLESFEYGTEIWLEDKLNGDIWHNFAAGSETYTFTANADDPHDRFVVHFFGPTSVNDNEANMVMIYGANEYAHISNLTKNEVVKEISIYSLAGNVIMNKQVPEQNRYRFFVSNHDGFYIVRVVTDKNIYTEKIFIH